MGPSDDRNVPFIVLTAYTRDQLPPALAEAPYLLKPLQAQWVLRELESLLRPQEGAAKFA